MRLRKYEPDDAKNIISWLDNERDFRLWSADRYNSYPITENEINENYKKCSEMGFFQPMTLIDDNEIPIGHLILRSVDSDDNIIRFGFIIVDNKVRGKGYGKILIRSAIEYVRNELNVRKISLGVFKENVNAYKCYLASGFREVDIEKDAYVFDGEKWDCIEMILE